MMRKIVLPLTLLGAAVLAPPLQAADGNINVTGRVVESSCVLHASSKSQKVDMGTRFAGGPIGGAIKVGQSIAVILEDCPESISQVQIRFEGTAASSNNFPGKVFATDNSDQPDAAKNVGFLISNAQGDGGGYFEDLLRVNEFSPAIGLEKGINFLYFNMGYSTGSASPTVGVARARVQFSLIYP